MRQYVDIESTMDIAAGEGNHVGEVLVYICWGGHV